MANQPLNGGRVLRDIPFSRALSLALIWAKALYQKVRIDHGIIVVCWHKMELHWSSLVEAAWFLGISLLPGFTSSFHIFLKTCKIPPPPFPKPMFPRAPRTAPGPTAALWVAFHRVAGLPPAHCVYFSKYVLPTTL